MDQRDHRKDVGDVELGFLEKCDPWHLESRFFPSKVGGRPSWVNLDFIPGAEELKCKLCSRTMIFLCQLYAPYDECTHIPVEGNISNFHRTIFVFICRNAKCCVRNRSGNIKVYRSSLSRINKFYPFDPPEDKPIPELSIHNFITLCQVCGCFADKKCSKCKSINYCTKQHQVLDWKQHKNECGSEPTKKEQSKSTLLFPEWEIITETESLDNGTDSNNDELKEFEGLDISEKTGSLADVPEKELLEFAKAKDDKVFRKFQERVKVNPEQVIRYQRGGKPLWIAKEPLPSDVPNCDYCGGPRRFEFQIMPQLLNFLEDDNLDWGVLAVYTCVLSCTVGKQYKEEYVFKQDVEVTEDES